MLSKLQNAAVITLLTLLAACSSAVNTSQPAPSKTEVNQPAGYQTLSIDAFTDILAKQKGKYKIVNVHTPYEGEIEGTDAKIPYNDPSALMVALPDKNAPIILYCRSGRMSEIASKALIEKGYTQVWDVVGGMIAWEASGRKIVDK